MGKKGNRAMNLCNPEGFRKQIDENLREGEDNFFSWFDGGLNKEEALKKAAEIFKKLVLPLITQYIQENLLKRCRSLEIGYGSGGQLAEAANVFGKSFGVDVHSQREVVYDAIGKKNVELLQTDGKTLPVDDGSIHFVHSWTTIIHMDMDTLKCNLKEIHRVLSPGGAAVLFYGRYIRSKTRQGLDEYMADVMKESTAKPGYREGSKETKVRAIRLVVSRWFMSKLCTEAGFNVVGHTYSHDVVNGRPVIHGQHGIVIAKPGDIPEESLIPVLKPKTIKPKLKPIRKKKE
jgi:ubiquinone/menaquinone biosynthesis C-methylase UbiE